MTTSNEQLVPPDSLLDGINWHKPAHRAVLANVKLGSWMSAALDDATVCEEMKADIREWFSAGEPMETLCQALAALRTPLAAPVCWVNRRKSDGSIDWHGLWESKEHAENRDMPDHEPIPLYAGTPPAVEPDEGLVGKVARELWLADNKRVELWDNPPSRQWAAEMVKNRDEYRAKAHLLLIAILPSIRAQALEEAAKVAEAHKPMGYMSDRERSYCTEHSEEIAAAIRSMKEGDRR